MSASPPTPPEPGQEEEEDTSLPRRHHAAKPRLPRAKHVPALELQLAVQQRGRIHVGGAVELEEVVVVRARLERAVRQLARLAEELQARPVRLVARAQPVRLEHHADRRRELLRGKLDAVLGPLRAPAPPLLDLKHKLQRDQSLYGYS
ncbi:hypothetical protein FIBSPDRAFT_968751 [Athelia psychrophila]|uniref:Uncharacterized protein n=1 Tax=Athelia psychrophila TaxID=1759441 RepID=A0A167U9B5_9AGAM|nr:hypothetical protein FIBSPDRAFT_968751 [Fibularhizoctonia sp. CBS 109695]